MRMCSGGKMRPLSSGRESNLSWKWKTFIFVYNKAIGSKPLFEEDEFGVAAIAAFTHAPQPLLGRVEGSAGKLPIEQIGLFALITVGFHGGVFVSLPHPFDFPQ